MSDDVRMPWGEEEEILGESSLHWYTPQPQPQRGPVDDGLDARIAVSIAEGICPWCKRDLDLDLFCSTCGLNAAAPRRRDWTPERDADDYMPRLPGAVQMQFVDEYAPASVDDEAAA